MDTKALIRLAEHDGITHWGVSRRIFNKGNFFALLKGGKDCTTRTLERAHQWFYANWPDDLEWPMDIPVPDRQIREEA